MNEEAWNEVLHGASLPDLYLKEKKRRLEIETRYKILIDMIKQEGCDRVSQQIKDELDRKYVN